MWTTIGARLLNLFFRNLVCMSAFYNAFALVGCGWNNVSAGGLWCWNFTEHSSAYGVVGARLLIYREMMCMRVPVILPLILSAVDMVLVYRLACGVGL